MDRNFIEAHNYKGIPYSKGVFQEKDLLSILREHAYSIGDRNFLTVVNDEGNDITINFSDFFSLVLKWSSWFRKATGNKVSETVGIIAVNDLESVIAIFGLLNSGCKILFINPTNPAKVTTGHLEQLDASVVLKSENLASTENSFEVVGLPTAEMLLNYPEDKIYIPDNLRDDTFYFPTSGSTSASKLVAQTHYGALVNANALQKHHQLDKNSLVLGCLPIYHVNGFHFTIIANLVSGSAAVLITAFSSFTFPNHIEKYKPTIVSIVPSIVEILLMVRRQWNLPEELKYAVTAAAPLSQNTAQKAYKQWGLKIMQGYGLTETINFSTKMPIHISEAQYEKMMLNRKIPSIGIALFGNEVALMDTNGNLITQENKEGEIVMRGHNIMKAYFAHPEETEKAFKHGWFHSGDIGYFQNCNESNQPFFFITGRAKNVAKVRGESISLEHMERVLKELSFIKDVACISKANSLLEEEIVVAYVNTDNQAFSITKCQDALKEDFPKHTIPENFVPMEFIPRTPTGKLKRSELSSILNKI